MTDNGVLEHVTSVTLERLPIDVMLVLDVSGSVAGEKLAHLIDAGQQLVRALHVGDRAGLITFSEKVAVDVPVTPDVAAVGRALIGLHGNGGTSLNDAVHAALTLRPVDTSRCLIVIFSDGADNYSWLPAAAIADEARRSTAVIDAVELRSDSRGVHLSPSLQAQLLVDRKPLLQALADASGGRVWRATSSNDLRTLFTHAIDEMRARYLLTYTPSSAPAPGWHALKVSLRNARGDVTARPGYLVWAQ